MCYTFLKGRKIMALIDIIFLIFVGLFALVGFYKGLVDSVLSLFSTLLSIILAIWGGVKIANYVRTLIDLDGYISSFLVDILKITEETVVIFGHEIVIANFIGTVLICILTFILLRLTIRTIGKILGSLTESSKLLKGANRLLGLAFGAIKGLLLVCALFVVLSMVSFVEPIRVKIEPTINDSKIVSVVYEKTNELVETKLREKLEAKES